MGGWGSAGPVSSKTGEPVMPNLTTTDLTQDLTVTDDGGGGGGGGGGGDNGSNNVPVNVPVDVPTPEKQALINMSQVQKPTQADSQGYSEPSQPRMVKTVRPFSAPARTVRNITRPDQTYGPYMNRTRFLRGGGYYG